MTNIRAIYAYLDGIAPFSTAMDFDNSGFLVGDGSVCPQSVLLALDITGETVKQAKQAGAALIVSHHPVIFQPLRTLYAGTVPYFLAQEGIGAICAHTNLDMAKGGVNDCLAAALRLQNVAPVAYDNGNPCCLMGRLSEPQEPESFADFVKEALSCEGVRFLEGDRKVHTVALCAGAGGDYLLDGIASGADAFVTGEVKHHQILAAKASGITLVDGGHFKTEVLVLEPLRKRLQEKFPEIRFFLEENASDGIHYR